MGQRLGILALEHGFEILEAFLGNEFLENIKASIEVLMLDGDTGLSDGVESFGIRSKEIHGHDRTRMLGGNVEQSDASEHASEMFFFYDHCACSFPNIISGSSLPSR